MQVPVNVVYDAAYEEIKVFVNAEMANKDLNPAAMVYILSRIQAELNATKADDYARIIMSAIQNQEVSDDNTNDQS